MSTTTEQAYKHIRQRHTRRELIRHGWALLLVFGAPVAGLVALCAMRGISMGLLLAAL